MDVNGLQVVRPDKDGYLTLSEANYWWQNGAGQTLSVDLGKLDLTSITLDNFPRGVGSTEYFNLLFRGNVNDGLVYGTIGLTLEDDCSVSAKYDDYDFDYKGWNSLGNIIRNTENFFGNIYAGEGTPYRINFYGKGTLGKPFSYTDNYIKTGGIR
ncbi:MAG: hypothetical protein GXX85_06120 [Ignavibacteria bacterium]|nr:hypothetical protein [Ignavibacteria bacterium]